MPAARNAAASAAASCASRIEHRQPLAAREEIAIVGAEQAEKPSRAELVRLGQRQQFDEEAGNWTMWLCVPHGMPVARADREAEPR